MYLYTERSEFCDTKLLELQCILIDLFIIIVTYLFTLYTNRILFKRYQTFTNVIFKHDNYL